jgi:HD-GYP domain-containing protein (c-di-GMP phosphodiesterase class II)
MEPALSGNPAPLLVPLDVCDVYGAKILSAGEHITHSFMKDIGRSGRFSTARCLALKDGRIRQDMEAALRTEPYAGRIPEERLEQIFRIYDDLAILPVLFDEFEFMRNRDTYLYQHVLRIAALTVSMAIDLFNAERASNISYIALTHDLGMLRLPGQVLKDNGKDAPENRRIAQGHTVIGYVLLTYYLGRAEPDCCSAALLHHERRDGSGYPQGIRFEDMVIDLLAVAGAFDALLARRPFRKEPFGRRPAIDLLWDQAQLGILNPIVVKLLVASSRQEPVELDSLEVAGEAEGLGNTAKADGTDGDATGQCPLSDRRNYS